MRYPDLTKTVQDLTFLDWEEGSVTPNSAGNYLKVPTGSGGSFLKATTGSGTAAIYYKAPTFDEANGFFGHECVNEVIASRLMDILGVPHVKYALVHARVKVDDHEYVTWVNSSKSYRHSAETKQSFAHFYEQFRQEGETPLALCERMGWSDFIQQMLLVDYLIINQDRHGANIEVLHLPNGRRRLAPLFDNGNSLVFSCYDVESAIRNFDPLVDAVGNSFIGSKRLAENLDLVRPNVTRALHASDRERLFRGLDAALPAYHLDKIWDIIWERWSVYANLRNS